MKHKSLSYEEIQRLIQYYQGQPIEKLKLIKPNWAFDKQSSKILDTDLRDKTKFIFSLANPLEVVKCADFGNFDTSNLFTGEWDNDNRIARILHAWENNYFVDPPTICLLTKSMEKKISFSDGRHRTKLSFHLEYPKIPIAIYREELNKISSIIKLEK